ncbi:MAG: transporter, partial [Spirochaetes bacterium]
MGDEQQAAQSEGGIKRSSRTRTRKKKKNQIPLGIIALLFVVAVGIIL